MSLQIAVILAAIQTSIYNHVLLLYVLSLQLYYHLYIIYILNDCTVFGHIIRYFYFFILFVCIFLYIQRIDLDFRHVRYIKIDICVINILLAFVMQIKSCPFLDY